MVNMDELHEVEDCSNEPKTDTTELASIPQSDTEGEPSVAENLNEVSNNEDKVREFIDDEAPTPKSFDDEHKDEDLVENNEVDKGEDVCDDVQFEEKSDNWKRKLDIYSSTSSSSNEDSELEDPKNLTSGPSSEKCSDSLEHNQQCKSQEDPAKSDSESEFLGFEGEPDPTARTAIYQKLIAKSEAAVDIDKWSSCSGSVSSASSDYNSDDGEQSNVSLQGREKYDTLSERDEDDVSSTSKNNNDRVDYGENGSPSNFTGGSTPSSPHGTKRTDGYPNFANKGKRQFIDLNSPAFKLPFTMGWKREVVYRSTVDGGANNKRLADIYYYTPTGKKMRSTREVLEYLEETKSPLSVDNFTFLKDCVHPDDPSQEIIREAKKISIKDDGGRRKSRSKSNTPTMGSPHPDWMNESPLPRKGKITPIHVGSYQSKGGNKRRIYHGHGMGSESGLYSPPWSNIPGSDSPRYEGDGGLWSGNPSKKSSDAIMPCSIRCPGLAGVVPTLQCQICVCLYHPECVGGIPLHFNPSSYVCKNCDRDSKENHVESSSQPGNQTIPPPLVPIDRLGKTSPTHGYAPSAPPRLQRFPQLHVDGRGDQRTISNSSYVPGVTVYARNRPPVFIRGVVGNSGSSRSNVGMNFPDSFAREPSVGQSVAVMQGRKYVVVPKNVLSVLPGAANAAAAAAAAFSGGNISRGSVIPISREWLCSQPLAKPTTVRATGGTFIPPSPIQPAPPQPFMSTNPQSIPGLVKSCEMKPQYVIISSPVQANMAGTNRDVSASSESSVVTPRTSESNDNGVVYRPAEENQVPRKRKLTLLRDDQPSSKRSKKSHTNGYSPAKKGNVADAMEEDEFSEEEEESNNVPKPKRFARKDMFSENFMNNLSSGYSALLHVFHYLNVQDLLRAAMVCRLWRDLAGRHHSLWRTVRMKNSQVVDWDGFADALARNRTEILDLRKMLLPPSGPPLSSASGTEVSGSKGRDRRSQWGQEFSRAISRASSSLRRLELCRCGMDVLEGVGSSSPLLTALCAQAIRSYELNLDFVGKLRHIQELRLKSPSGMNLNGDLTPLDGLVSLKHLSITTVTDLAGDDGERLSVLGSLTNLESLELGECSVFGEAACSAIGNLQNLSRLRLEKGEVGEKLGGRSLLDGENNVIPPGLLEALAKLPLLVQLELVNFDIGMGFDSGLEKCTKLQRLLIIPNYVAQSATSNKMVLSGAMKLAGSLNTFTWGVTHEVLQAIELFVASDNASGKKGNSSSDEDQEEGKRSGHRGKTLPSSECLPILKPLPFATNEDKESKDEQEDSAEDDKFSRVEFVPLTKLHGYLSEVMPGTKVQIVKMPFSATWRQGISEVDL